MTIQDKARLVIALTSKGYNLIDAINASNGVDAERLFNEYLGGRIRLSDIFIGNFRISQRFGSNPQMYLKFGWKGHNGIDFACPSGTKLISCVNGVVTQAYNNINGWGNHIYIWDKSQKILVLYAHLSKINVKVGQNLSIGNLIGLSGNTGNSTGPHLHFGLYQTNDQGYKSNLGNGYGGAINSLDRNIVEWEIKNPTKPL